MEIWLWFIISTRPPYLKFLKGVELILFYWLLYSL